MPDPLIAIVGSVTTSPDAPRAAEDLGRELAKAGFRILVYSSAPEFLEPYVVKGYAASQVAKSGSIQVRYPLGGLTPSFAEQEDHPEVFDWTPDQTTDWEFSFYQSLNTVDGVLFLGGRYSTLIAGTVATGQLIPILALPAFGGTARKVWEALQPERDLPTSEEIEIMARPEWSDQLAAECVQTLKNQLARRAAVLQARRVEEVASARQRIETDPIVAVIGNVKTHSDATAAAENLGHELARNGIRILVYSSDDSFLEPAVVRGYIASGAAKPGSIQVRYPRSAHTSFREAERFPQVFNLMPDQVTDWEFSFFRSLNNVDGVLLAGGENSTLIAGVLAVSLRLAIVALAGLGGAAARIWAALRPDRDLPTDAEIRIMAQPRWSPDVAVASVQALRNQFARRIEYLERLLAEERQPGLTDPGTGDERLRLAYLTVLARPEAYELLEHLDPQELRKAVARLGLSLTPGAGMQELLAKMEERFPSSAPSPLWLAWMEIVNEEKVRREEAPRESAQPRMPLPA